MCASVSCCLASAETSSASAPRAVPWRSPPLAPHRPAASRSQTASPLQRLRSDTAVKPSALALVADATSAAAAAAQLRPPVASSPIEPRSSSPLPRPPRAAARPAAEPSTARALAAPLAPPRRVAPSAAHLTFASRGMGLLSKGTPLEWDESRRFHRYVKAHAIRQFLNIFRNQKERSDDLFLCQITRAACTDGWELRRMAVRCDAPWPHADRPAHVRIALHLASRTWLLTSAIVLMCACWLLID